MEEGSRQQIVENDSSKAAKDLVAGAAGGVAQVLIGLLSLPSIILDHL
jgi:hypothetical protein